MVEGGLWFANWGKNIILGMIDPVVGAIVLFNETTGLICFMPDGTVAFPPGYKPLLATVLKANEPNGVCVKFLPSFPVLPTEDET